MFLTLSNFCKKFSVQDDVILIDGLVFSNTHQEIQFEHNQNFMSEIGKMNNTYIMLVKISAQSDELNPAITYAYDIENTNIVFIILSTKVNDSNLYSEKLKEMKQYVENIYMCKLICFNFYFSTSTSHTRVYRCWK